MTEYRDPSRQLQLSLMLLAELAPGSVCLASDCPTGEPVPHMANDQAAHPSPYGTRPPWSARVIARVRKDRRRFLATPTDHRAPERGEDEMFHDGTG